MRPRAKPPSATAQGAGQKLVGEESDCCLLLSLLLARGRDLPAWPHYPPRSSITSFSFDALLTWPSCRRALHLLPAVPSRASQGEIIPILSCSSRAGCCVPSPLCPPIAHCLLSPSPCLALPAAETGQGCGARQGSGRWWLCASSRGRRLRRRRRGCRRIRRSAPGAAREQAPAQALAGRCGG